MRRWPSVLVCVATVGCGGGAPRPPDAAQGRDASDAAADGDAADGADAFDAAPKPLPVASARSRLLVPGPATLLGSGADSCTNAVPAGGDRWCAFGRPAVGRDWYELWVVDVTKAATGATITCDGADASCLRVSTRLFKGKRSGFAGGGFNGDTLIFGDAPYPGTNDDPFVGVLRAWRPGWTSGRALTSELGRFCVGQERSDAAQCFENLDGDGMVQNVTIELHAGLVSAEAGPPLPKLDSLLLTGTTDASGAPPRYQFGLSPDGAYALWSTRATAGDVETLHAAKLADVIAPDVIAPFVVARDVSQWAASPDGLAWYWLTGYDHNLAGAPSGTLQAAAFPDGSSPTPLATAVGDFGVVGDKSLWFRTDVAAEVGTLRWLPDRGAPTSAATVDTKVLTVLGSTRDGARFLYAKTFAPIRPDPEGTVSGVPDLVDLYAGSPAGAAPCVVAASPAALNAALSTSGELAVWERSDTLATAQDGVATTLPSCDGDVFATHLRKLLPAGEREYVYLDDADPSSSESTLRYARIVNGALVVGPPIQTRAAPVFAPLEPALPAVAYTVETGTDADGLYLFLQEPADGSTDAGAAP